MKEARKKRRKTRKNERCKEGRRGKGRRKQWINKQMNEWVDRKMNFASWLELHLPLTSSNSSRCILQAIINVQPCSWLLQVLCFFIPQFVQHMCLFSLLLCHCCCL
jgi:hypothetical protein